MFREKILCLPVALMLLVALNSWAAEPRTMIAVRVQNPPRIDGTLDDSCWRLAVPTSGFIQMDPDEGKPATEQTIVRVLYDNKNLYLGIECLNSRPEKIISRLVTRDSNFWPGDLISVVLDTFHDHQNCYIFQINPRGVQRDLRCYEDGRRGWGSSAWDGLWWSEAKITASGWTSEIAIPFNTLRFSRGKEQIWGVNIQRYRASKREDSNWSFISRDDGRATKVSRAGHLLGLKDIKPGLHLEFLPYGMARYTQNLEKDERRWQKDTGLDIKYGIASNLTLDATLNPDFCHIEADEERINLSRFELRYREKRPFFIEGRKLFTPMNLFYSRQIVDPKLGAKVTGKIGEYSIGLLAAVDKEEGPDPAYGVFRFQKDILKNSSVGIIGVGKQKSEDQYSRALGADLGLRLKQNALNLRLMKSFNPGVEGDDWKISIRFSRFTDKFWIGGRFKNTRPEFNVDQTGYVPHDPHVGKKEFKGWLGYSFFIKRFGIRRLNLNQQARASKRTDDNRWGWRWENVGLYIQLENYNGINFWHKDWYLRWQQKGYRGETFGLGYNIQGKGFIRRAYISAQGQDQYDWEDDYFGKIREISIWAETRPRDNLSLDLDGNIVWEYFPSGKLDEIKKVGNFRVTYFPTRHIFLRVFAPFNPSAHQYAVNALLSYAYRPMSRFYLAYNEQRSKDMKLTDRIIMAKFSYLWNL